MGREWHRENNNDSSGLWLMTIKAKWGTMQCGTKKGREEREENGERSVEEGRKGESSGGKHISYIDFHMLRILYASSI